MNGTPASQRLHIVLVGERNSGKSSLLNAIAGQQVAIVSDVPGTTTDRVSKAMEIMGLGPCLLVDTAGLDDAGELGGKRVGNAMDAVSSADVLLVVVDASTGRLPEIPFAGGAAPVGGETPVGKGIAVLPVINKSDTSGTEELDALCGSVTGKYGKAPVVVSALRGEGVPALVSAIAAIVPEDWDAPLLTEGVASPGDLVVLVMPQDPQAPKGRLILPQQQTIRELLDRKCRVVCCTPDTLAQMLSSLSEAPAAVITDSQSLAAVKPLTASGTHLTSFSMLLAASKGDMEYFRESVRKIDTLTPDSRVLIAEACTHVPASEDIGRVQIPGMMRRRVGDGLRVDVVSGRDFPDDLGGYDLVIHCGACMFNRRYVLSRVFQAKRQNVPMTNYGVTIAYLNNLL